MSVSRANTWSGSARIRMLAAAWAAWAGLCWSCRNGRYPTVRGREEFALRFVWFERVEGAQEPVLHREERGRGPGGRADLGVDPFDVVAGGLRARCPARWAICRVDAARASSTSTSTSRGVSPAGPRRGAGVAGGRRCPAPPRPRRGRARPPGHGAQLPGRRLGWVGAGDGVAPRAWRGSSRRRRAAGPGPGWPCPQTAVVAGAVEPFVGQRGDHAELGEQRRPAQHPVGVVGVQPHALPLQLGQRPGLVPDRVRHPGAAEVVQQPGPAQRLHVRFAGGRPGERPPRRGRRRRASGRRSTATSGRRSRPPPRGRRPARCQPRWPRARVGGDQLRPSRTRSADRRAARRRGRGTRRRPAGRAACRCAGGRRRARRSTPPRRW